ncbi:MAG: hypothetical protein M1815_001604 [Lichina confinis]|nr:MAG: hypothetical protein M1815_001604 [Lichina confinis]
MYRPPTLSAKQHKQPTDTELKARQDDLIKNTRAYNDFSTAAKGFQQNDLSDNCDHPSSTKIKQYHHQMKDVVDPAIFTRVLLDNSDAEFSHLINAKFDMYCHHCCRVVNGKGRMGWVRTMVHSLTQQMLAQDPAYYAIVVAARPDRNWRLISYPFTHLDLNVARYLESGRGANLVQSFISLDDEDTSTASCVVAGFHRHLEVWYREMEAAGMAPSQGMVTGFLPKMYTAEHQERYRHLTPVVQRRGGLRVTLPTVLHSAAPVAHRRRQGILLWPCGFGNDHGALDNVESGTWEEMSRHHHDLTAPPRTASGHPQRYSCLMKHFPASVRLRSTSAIGDAMVGACRYDNPAVLSERNLLLSNDDQAALRWVKTVRERLKLAWLEAWEVVPEAEQQSFGERAFFSPHRDLKQKFPPLADESGSSSSEDEDEDKEDDGGDMMINDIG